MAPSLALVPCCRSLLYASDLLHISNFKKFINY